MTNKGEYDIFQVDDEKVVSDYRDKIKEYAKSKGRDKIEYKMSVYNLDDIEDYIKL